MLQQQWPWLTPSGHPPAMSAAATLHLFITALIFDENCIFSLMYVGCLAFVLKEKCVKLCENSEMSLCFVYFIFFFFFLPFKHWPRYCIFFLLDKSSWLLYIVRMLTMITYLLAVQGALLPACVCMKGVSTVWLDRGRRDEDNDIGSVCVIATTLNVFLFLSMRDSWKMFVRAYVCVRVHACVCACFWTLIQAQSGKWINLTARIRKERKSVCKCEWVFVHLTVWILWQLQSSKTLALCLLSCVFLAAFCSCLWFVVLFFLSNAIREYFVLKTK